MKPLHFNYFKILIEERIFRRISTSNHMFGRAIWDKLPELIFENQQTLYIETNNKYCKMIGIV